MTTLDTLREKIRAARDSYWAVGLSALSDAEYDEAVEELYRLTGGYDPVMGPEVVSSGKVRHPKHAPMLSMQKVYSEDEIVKWIKRQKVDTIHVMPKYDGIALRRYSNGVIATRGDGYRGENVTAVAMPFVAKADLPGTAWIDGEAVCSYPAFGELARLGYKNPRNAVSGILSSKDAAIRERASALTFVPYASNIWSISSVRNTEQGVRFVVEDIKAKMQSKYPMDGIVFKVGHPQVFRELGHTDHHWRGQIALKFKGETKRTTILRIDWQVRNGTVTPVALLQPVDLDGARIERVTLHNADYVQANAVCEGDVVVIERAGGVIPSVVRVLHGQKIGFPFVPTECPMCHSKLLRQGTRLYCPVCEHREKRG